MQGARLENALAGLYFRSEKGSAVYSLFKLLKCRQAICYIAQISKKFVKTY